MEELILVKPTLAYGEEIMALRQELLAEEGQFAGCMNLRDCTTAEEWMEVLDKYENHPPEEMVPSTTYLAIRPSDNRLVGITDLRHHINHPILGLWGGNVGYTIRPSERGKGYAKEMLRLLLGEARRRGMERLLITCNSLNTASERVIRGAGGVFDRDVVLEDRTMKRFWITL